jgi:hypothetical protein
MTLESVPIESVAGGYSATPNGISIACPRL